MGLWNSTGARSRGRLAALTVLLVLGLGAAPIRAGGFERSFENELGRIAAREVVHFGKMVLIGGYGPYYRAHWAAAYPVPAYPAHPAYAPRPRRPVYYAPMHPVAAPEYAYPPAPAAPCEHVAAPPYQERIVWERYERVIQGEAPPPPVYDPYEQQVRY